jgi:hypothetical protein
MVGAAMYLPEAWLTDEARQRTRIPPTIRFQEKWRLALTLRRQVRAAGFHITAVLGCGDNATLRRTLDRLQLPYALGISSTVTVFRGTPSVAVPPRQPGRAGTPTRRRSPARRVPKRLERWRPPCRRARGAASRGAMGPIARGRRSSPPCESRPRTIGAPDGWRPKSGCSSSAISALRRASRRISSSCRLPPRCALGPVGSSALGDRAAISSTERRAGARSLRGPLVSRLAPPCRPHDAH